MKVQAQWLDGRRFVGSTEEGHSIVMDGTPAGEGKIGISPMAMLLLGVAGCSSIDIVDITRKQRQKVFSCICRVEGTRAEDIPKVFTDIHLHYEVTGHNLEDEAVAKAIQLSAEKYCSASLMLGKAARITHSFACIDVEDESAAKSQE